MPSHISAPEKVALVEHYAKVRFGKPSFCCFEPVVKELEPHEARLRRIPLPSRRLANHLRVAAQVAFGRLKTYLLAGIYFRNAAFPRVPRFPENMRISERLPGSGSPVMR